MHSIPYLVDTSALQKTEGWWDWLPWRRSKKEANDTQRPEIPALQPPTTYEEASKIISKHEYVKRFLQEQCTVARFICKFIDWSIANIELHPENINSLEQDIQLQKTELEILHNHLTSLHLTRQIDEFEVMQQQAVSLQEYSVSGQRIFCALVKLLSATAQADTGIVRQIVEFYCNKVQADANLNYYALDTKDWRDKIKEQHKNMLIFLCNFVETKVVSSLADEAKRDMNYRVSSAKSRINSTDEWVLSKFRMLCNSLQHVDTTGMDTKIVCFIKDVCTNINEHNFFPIR